MFIYNNKLNECIIEETKSAFDLLLCLTTISDAHKLMYIPPIYNLLMCKGNIKNTIYKWD